MNEKAARKIKTHNNNPDMNHQGSTGEGVGGSRGMGSSSSMGGGGSVSMSARKLRQRESSSNMIDGIDVATKMGIGDGV